MIEVRPSTEEDLDFVRLNPLEEQVKNYPKHPIMGECSTGLYNGKVFVVGGVMKLWEGVGEAWVIFTKDVMEFKYEGFMTIKRELKRMIKEGNYRRVQATIRADFPKAIEMIEFMGFTNETPNGLVYYFPDGCDAYIYARLK
jgi:hypothetical protein